MVDTGEPYSLHGPHGEIQGDGIWHASPVRSASSNSLRESEVPATGRVGSGGAKLLVLVGNLGTQDFSTRSSGARTSEARPAEVDHMATPAGEVLRPTSSKSRRASVEAGETYCHELAANYPHSVTTCLLRSGLASRDSSHSIVLWPHTGADGTRWTHLKWL